MPFEISLCLKPVKKHGDALLHGILHAVTKIVTMGGSIEVDLINHTMTAEGSMVVIDPNTGECYILGEVNGNGWAANLGVAMQPADEENVFTATITTAGENEGYSYFNFTTKLAETEDAWGSIDAYRFGAVTDGGAEDPFLVTDEMLNQELSLSDFGANPTSFKIEQGQWQLTVNLNDRKIVIARVGGDEIIGDVNGDGEVSIADVTMLVSLVVDQSSNEHSDVNQDGETGIADVTTLVGMLMEQN